MQDGWFIVLILLALITFGGIVAGFWIVGLLRESHEKETLTMEDLQLLQESVETLITNLRQASDEAIIKMDNREKELKMLLNSIDQKFGISGSLRGNVEEVYQMAEEGLGKDEIARRSGRNRGEVELLLGLEAAKR